MSSKRKVLLGMSGGIDSTMSVKLLLDQSYDVHGLTFVMTEEKNATKATKSAVDEAQELAKKFGIPHQVIDIKKKFRENVIQYFMDEYIKGRTPNPCVLCNRILKFQELLQYANEINADFIATGHYVQVADESNRYFLRKAVDGFKDQSYMLWRLSQEQLSRSIFPLGKMKKQEIKDLAKDIGLKDLAEKKESVDVCFIPEGDYREFLQEHAAEIIHKIPEGDFLLNKEKKVGKHKGYPYYTIGQRKGLQIALGEPMYVNNIDASSNTISIGRREDLLHDKLDVEQVSLMKYKEMPKEDLLVKIRYHDKGMMAKFDKVDNDNYHLDFVEKVSAITPGQSAVFYENEDVVGGGIIK